MSKEELQINISADQMYKIIGAVRDEYLEFSYAGIKALSHHRPWQPLALIDSFVSDIISSENAGTQGIEKYFRLDEKKINFWGGRGKISPFDYFCLYDLLEPNLYRYSYHVELYIQSMEKVYFCNRNNVSQQEENDERGNGKTAIGLDVFKDLVAEISRRASKDLVLRNQKDSQKKLSDKNFESAKKYIDALFSGYDKLYVWRFNLIASFWKDIEQEPERHNDEAEQHCDKDEIHSFLDTFLRNWRSNKMFKPIVGYIWKLELTKERGYFFKFIFFVSEKKPPDSAELKKKIGSYWVKTTNHKGAYSDYELVLDCPNPREDKAITSKDEEERRELLFLIRYLTSKDCYLQYLRCGLDKQKRRRSFGHGQIKRCKWRIANRC